MEVLPFVKLSFSILYIELRCSCVEQFVIFKYYYIIFITFPLPSWLKRLWVGGGPLVL